MNMIEYWRYYPQALPIKDESFSSLQARFLSWVQSRGIALSHTSQPDSLVWKIQPTNRTDQQRTFSAHADEAFFHTDSGYEESPEPWLALYCLRPAKCGGGVSALLDGAQILTQLRCESEALYQALKLDYPIRIPDVFLKPGQSSFIQAPILRLEPFLLRYRYDTMLAGLKEFGYTQNSLQWQAVTRLKELIQMSVPIKISLQAGDVLVIDNHQALHARTAFKDHQRCLLRIRYDALRNQESKQGGSL